jgi:hypothetical protein
MPFRPSSGCDSHETHRREPTAANGLMVAQMNQRPSTARRIVAGRRSGGNSKMAQRHKRQPVRITATPDELVQHYRDGASLNDLAVMCDCGAGRIRRILIAHGVEIRPRGYGKGNSMPGRYLRR